ncbi:MAG TPA: NYN domain-containing protein [Pseudonocardiaceae bacterium]
MGQAVIYVDGWNLYHGIKSRYGRTYLWLDLDSLAARMRQPDTILKVRYFTTIVAGEPDAARNQETYLAALTNYRPAVGVVRGRFKRKQFRCSECGQRWTCGCTPAKEFATHEEKLTDVALGVSMVTDAAQGHGDVSVLISTDSDFNPAIVACAEIAPHRPIYLACPPGRQPPRRQLPPNVTTFLISHDHLAGSLLPDEVAGSHGRIYRRPAKWQ